jgi:transcription-repair coupling factor (superfamily II helicase)
VEYVAAEDDRLEAYRRLGAAGTLADLADVRTEWVDRFGPLPAAAESLLQLGELRVECLRVGVREVTVQPARVGVRSTPVARLSPLTLPISAQLRIRRLHGRHAYDEATRTVRIDLDPQATSPAPLIALLRDLVPPE